MMKSYCLNSINNASLKCRDEFVKSRLLLYKYLSNISSVNADETVYGVSYIQMPRLDFFLHTARWFLLKSSLTTLFYFRETTGRITVYKQATSVITGHGVRHTEICMLSIIFVVPSLRLSFILLWDLRLSIPMRSNNGDRFTIYTSTSQIMNSICIWIRNYSHV